MSKLTLKDIDFQDKKVIVRVDFNVPLNKNQEITDDARIQAALPTIRYLLDNGAKRVILMSHLGRPKGEVVDAMRLGPVGEKLAQILGQEVETLKDCVGDEINAAVNSTAKRVILLENLRFHKEEKKGDEDFARKLATLADIYVNDAFGTAHRAHASTTTIAKFLPSCIGLLIEKEINFLAQALNPKKPYVVILGGVKVSDKIEVVNSLIEKCDRIIIGGAMAYTFLKAQGINTGASRVEEDKLCVANSILAKAKEKNVEIILPLDHLVVDSIDNFSSKKIVDDIPVGFMGVDIGMKSIKLFKEKLSDAKTVLWNGPLGIFENPEFSNGTKEIALFLGDLTESTVIVGGGDSASAAKKFGVKDKLSHVSTGGGASLEFLEGKELPGIAAIANK